MDVQICSQCNWPMEDSHFPICWTCWKECQGYGRSKADDRYDSLQKIIHQLLEETPDTGHLDNKIKSLQVEIHNLKMEISSLRYQAQNKPPPIDQALIKSLLRFCHPDKNQDRQEEAGEITKVLLALREKK